MNCAAVAGRWSAQWMASSLHAVGLVLSVELVSVSRLVNCSWKDAVLTDRGCQKTCEILPAFQRSRRVLWHGFRRYMFQLSINLSLAFLKYYNYASITKLPHWICPHQFLGARSDPVMWGDSGATDGPSWLRDDDDEDDDWNYLSVFRTASLKLNFWRLLEQDF